MTLPAKVKAVCIESQGVVAITDVSLPKLRDDYLLIRTTAVAVNPTDCKHIDVGIQLAGTRAGCDCAGIVEEVGNNLTKQFHKGDRVAAFAHGSNKVQPEDGVFSEYSVVKAGVAFKIPDHISDEEAAALGLGIATVGQGLYRTLKLPLPTNPLSKPQPILIYGGTTATGILGVQFAKLSGYTVVTTCSAKNFAYARSLGADAVFDYADAEKCIAGIRDFTKGQLRLAWDCVASAATARICAGALSKDDESHYSSLLPVEPTELTAINPKIHVAISVAYVCMGERFDEFGTLFAAQPQEYEFATILYEMSRRLLEEGKLKPVRQVVNQGGSGLEGVLSGLQQVREGKVSATKLVYTL